MINDIGIKLASDLNSAQVKQLVTILNEDGKLKQSLGSQGNKITAKQFQTKNINWAKEHNAKIFAIMKKNQAIGMISLSHIDLKNKKANIGYWLANRYWEKGITTAAFKLILEIAKNDKIKYLSCTIEKDNKASIGILQFFHAKITEKDGDIIPILKL